MPSRQKLRSSPRGPGPGARAAGVSVPTLPGAAPPDPGLAQQETLVETAVRILRNRKWLVLQVMIAIPLLVLVLTLLQKETYSAQASLLFRQAPSATGDNGGFFDPDRESATNQELIDLPAVAQGTARAVGAGLTGREVEEMVSLDAAGQSDVVNIEAKSEDPALAARVANAYGRAYIDFRKQADRDQLTEAIRLVERNVEALSAEQNAGENGRRLRAQLADLRFRQSLQTGNAELVQSARTPADPSSPSLRRNLILAVLLAAGIAFALASLLERLDRRLKTPEALERLYGLPVLSRIPRSRELRRGRRGLADAFGNSAEAEAFRTLRANLRLAGGSRDQPQSLLVVSPASGDGKSTVSRFLAMTMAAMGDRVVLVETDLHKQGLNGPEVDGGDGDGLSGVLAGSIGLEEALVEIPLAAGHAVNGDRRLVVLPSGPPAANPSELLETARMRSVLQELESRFDVVVLDSAPLSTVSDALSLVPEVTGVLVVSGLGHTTRDGAQRLRKQLSLMNANPVGVVANFAATEQGGVYYA